MDIHRPHRLSGSAYSNLQSSRIRLAPSADLLRYAVKRHLPVTTASPAALLQRLYIKLSRDPAQAVTLREDQRHRVEVVACKPTSERLDRARQVANLTCIICEVTLATL